MKEDLVNAKEVVGVCEIRILFAGYELPSCTKKFVE